MNRLDLLLYQVKTRKHRMWVVRRHAGEMDFLYWRGGSVRNGKAWTPDPTMACLYYTADHAERDAQASDLAREHRYKVRQLRL